MEQPSDHSFDRAFREKMQGVERMPSELPWIGISAALDQMRRKRRRGWLLGMAFAAALLALLLLFKPFSSDNSTAGDEQWINAFSALPAWETPALRGGTESGSGNSNSEASALSGTESTSAAPALKSGRMVEQGLASSPLAEQRMSYAAARGDVKPAMNPHKDPVPPGPGMPGYLSAIHASGIPRDEQMSVERKSFVLPDGSFDPLSFRMLRIGFIGMAQATSLGSSGIDNFLADAAGRKRMKVRAAYGLSAALDFSRSFGVEVNLLISSSEGQAFKAGGRRPDLRSNYIRVPVMLKYRFLRAGALRGLPEAFCLKAGVEYGRLNWVNMDEFSNFIEPSQFNPTEFGAVADISYEKYLSPQHILTSGFRARLGSPGKAGNASVRSAALAFYLQLHYGFFKRNR